MKGREIIALTEYNNSKRISQIETVVADIANTLSDLAQNIVRFPKKKQVGM